MSKWPLTGPDSLEGEAPYRKRFILVKVTVEDGVTTFRFRQSWINTLYKCPEQARREMLGLTVRTVNDAMSMGTAVHAGIEALLRGHTTHDSLLKSTTVMDEIIGGSEGEFKWEQTRGRDEALNLIRYALMSFYKHTLPTVGTVASIEQSFKVELDRRDRPEETMFRFPDPEQEVLELTGTHDMANTDHVLWDWKTANREWQAWEPKRFYVQPTVYNYAYFVETGILPTFNYIVFNKNGKVTQPQVVPVTRTQEDFDWLRHQLWAVVDLYKATNGGAVAWPMLDQGWHCSPKWCPVFAAGECKGKYKDPSNPW